MIEQIKQFQNEITRSELSADAFSAYLKEAYDRLYALDAETSGLYDQSPEELEEILQACFDGRAVLKRETLRHVGEADPLDNPTVSTAYDLNRALRYLGDYVLEIIMSGKPAPPEGYACLSGEGPYFHVPDGQTFGSPDDLRSGDVILSRGNAFTSAAIARIGRNDTQFSHLSLVYRHPGEDGKLYTIESHMEVGAVVAPFQVHIDQKNSRTVVYRFRDGDMAHRAAEYMYRRVKAASDAGSNIEYNFSMQYRDPSRLFCSQVIYDGFMEVSNGNLDIPMFKTLFHPSLIGFLQRIGIPVSEANIDTFDTFAPGDMEFDPRFELVAEWKDPGKLSDSRIKDAVLTRMYAWMENEGYQIHPPTGLKIKSMLTWLFRRTPLTRIYFSKKLPLNMTLEQIKVFMTLDKIGTVLSDEVYREQAQKDRPLSIKEIYALLEAFRDRDVQRGRPVFHGWFRP